MDNQKKEYIERDTALNLLYDLYSNFDPSYDHGIGRSISTIKEMPAANVRPIDAGNWVASWGLMECSVCGKECSGAYKFCPNCGAMMAKEVK